MVEVNEESRLLVAEAAARERMLALREAALKRREKELSDIEAHVTDSDTNTADGASQLPLSSSELSSCVAALFIPAQLVQGPVEFVASPQYEVAKVTAARFEPQEKLIFTGRKPANPNIKVEYQRHFEEVVIRPAHQRSSPTPATFENIHTTVQLRPEYLDWQPCATGSAFCARKQQAELTAINQTILKTGLQLNTQQIDAITRQVEIELPIPPEHSIEGGYVERYDTIQVQALLSDEVIELTEVAATNVTLETWSLREAARVELRPVICAEDLATDSGTTAGSLLTRLRAGLNSAGYTVTNSGGFDTDLNKALRSYQRDHGLALSDELPSIESLSALGAYP